MNQHGPRDALAFPRFSQPVTFSRLPHTTDLTGVDVAVLGIPFDSDSNNIPGARYGPRAVREASQDFLREFNPRLGIAPFSELSVVDWGDAPVIPGDTIRSFEAVTEAMRPLFEARLGVVAVGGDHAVSLPHLRAARGSFAPLSLVLFDAHTDVADSWMTRYNHGTQFRRAVEEELIDPATSIMVGVNGPIYDDMRMEQAEALGIRAMSADDVFEQGIEPTVRAIRERTGENEIFLSFDVDVMEAAFAPGSGAKEIGGLMPREALWLLNGLRGLNVRCADVVEVSPLFDPTRVTSVLASNVVYTCISLMALRNRSLQS